ncbi:MAG: hypothetical protein M0Q49_09830 [Porticoccaceae bacterium]|jgi:hypothetical protein|nr:hypothetical protein [Porticoccaceae bacterium]
MDTTPNREWIGHSVIISLLSAILFSPATLAFKPTRDDGHVGITRDGIQDITRISSTGQEMKFSERALKELRVHSA